MTTRLTEVNSFLPVAMSRSHHRAPCSTLSASIFIVPCCDCSNLHRSSSVALHSHCTPIALRLLSGRARATLPPYSHCGAIALPLQSYRPLHGSLRLLLHPSSQESEFRAPNTNTYLIHE